MERRTAIRVGIVTALAAALGYSLYAGGEQSSTPKTPKISTLPIDPENLTVEDVQRFYPALSKKPEPVMVRVRTSLGTALIANYSGTSLDLPALTGVYSYFDSLTQAGGTINMRDIGTGKVTTLSAGPRQATKRILFVIDQDTPKPTWSPKDVNLAATTFEFPRHTVGYARVLRTLKPADVLFADNRLNSAMNFVTEVCQSLVQVSAAGPQATNLPRFAQEQICNGSAFGYVNRQRPGENNYSQYEKLFPQQVSIGGPSFDLVELEPDRFNSIPVSGLPMPPL